jgi:hypothetical protein
MNEALTYSKMNAESTKETRLSIPLVNLGLYDATYKMF